MLGSKIDNLKLLKDNGFNVPNFEVIRYEDVVDSTTFNINDELLLNKKNLSKYLKQKLKESINFDFDIKLDCKKYAVRSSSNLEDGECASFAGQFDTYLFVKKAELEDKIEKCFLSLYNENVLDYVAKKNISIDNIKMNVIVQEMISADTSGVIFTSNPQGLLNETVIVVGHGVGSGIVNDEVPTTSYYYNLTDKNYYYEGEESIFNHEQIEEIIETTNKIKTLLGEYLDIEFAIKDGILYILQARKITTISDKNVLILDNSNIVESYPGISLPLTCSFVNNVYSDVFKGVSYRILKSKKELDKYQDVFYNMVGSANGRLYYKISNWYTLIKFLPLNKKIIPVWQEMLGVKNKTYDNNKVNLNPFRRVMTYFNSVYELLRVPKNMKKLNNDFIEINEYFYNNFNDGMDSKDIVKLYRELENKILKSWDVTLLNDMYTFIYTGFLKMRLKKKYDNYEEISNKYIAGITNIESLKPIKELITLSYDKNKISKGQYDKRFSEYIKKYGDRNLEELKLESLTFRTSPELLQEKIDSYNADQSKLQELYDNISKDNLKLLKNEGFIDNKIIKKCQLGINNREISRMNRSRIYGMVRAMFLGISKNFVKEGIIDDERDIFYLTVEEIFSLVEKPAKSQQKIIDRKEEYKIYYQIPPYSRLLFMNGEFNKSHVSINQNIIYLNNDELKGIPCSNGIVTGEVLIVDNVREIADVKDKILVTKMTDPGWVFLLATAKGVIAEKGSLLSHTAIISRELKIPSIVGVDNLLKTLKNGDIIEMNGNTGRIKIIRSSDQNENS